MVQNTLIEYPLNYILRFNFILGLTFFPLRFNFILGLIFFPLFQTHYHTLPYPKIKEKKI